MIEQGIVLLIQAGLGTPPIAPGGWGVQLDKDQICAANPMAWTWRTIVSEPSIILEGQDGFTTLELQIDCHGLTMTHAMTLARAIDGVLRGGWSGTLPDADATYVHGIFREPPAVDGFSDLNHSFVRTIEYSVQFDQI